MPQAVEHERSKITRLSASCSNVTSSLLRRKWLAIKQIRDESHMNDYQIWSLSHGRSGRSRSRCRSRPHKRNSQSPRTTNVFLQCHRRFRVRWRCVKLRGHAPQWILWMNICLKFTDLTPSTHYVGIGGIKRCRNTKRCDYKSATVGLQVGHWTIMEPMSLILCYPWHKKTKFILI